jgi:MFS family permease
MILLHCFVGVTNDLLVYSIIIPVIPFHLEDLGYHDISSLVGWLLFAYVCCSTLFLLVNPPFKADVCFIVKWFCDMYVSPVTYTTTPHSHSCTAAVPIAMFSERYSIRRLPLIAGLLALLGSQALLMEAPAYWVMCLSRVLQGISSSVVWTLGIALL